MGQEAVSEDSKPTDRLYFWPVPIGDEMVIVLALAPSPEDAVMKASVKLMGGVSDPVFAIAADERLRAMAPHVLDFSGGAAMTVVDLSNV